LQIQNNITVGAEALTLSGTGISNDGALRNINGTNTYGGLLTLGSAARINSDSGTLNLSHTGTITGATFGLAVGGAGNTTIASIIGTTSGTLTKDGAGTLTLTGASTYTGTTTVSVGTLLVSGTGSINSTAGVALATGATLRYNSTTAYSGGAITNSGGAIAGSGNLGTAILSGSGSINPGNSPGILTAAQVNPSGGLAFNFEFNATGGPDFTTASASINDVLHLTNGTTPFSSSLTGSNTISLYLTPAIAVNDSFTGGFFTDQSADFAASISGATFAYYVYGNGLGGHAYNGLSYYTLSEYNPSLAINVSTIQVGSAAFATGTTTNGYIMQLGVVPEPATCALLALSLATIIIFRRKRTT
jgi:autotransporter-associated beta strand protein